VAAEDWLTPDPVGSRTLVATQNPNLVPTAILLGAAVVPAAFVTFISGRRRQYAVGGVAFAASAFLGGVIGLVVAGTVEFDVQRDLGALPMIGVGLIEETSKLIVGDPAADPPLPHGRRRSAARCRRRRRVRRDGDHGLAFTPW